MTGDNFVSHLPGIAVTVTRNSVSVGIRVHIDQRATVRPLLSGRALSTSLLRHTDCKVSLQS